MYRVYNRLVAMVAAAAAAAAAVAAVAVVVIAFVRFLCKSGGKTRVYPTCFNYSGDNFPQ